MNTAPRGSAEPDSKERLRLWLRLLKVTHLIESRLREKLRREFATTLPRFDVMSALARHPEGLKMSELSRFLMVSNGNVTGIIDRLTDEGLALREQVPGDRRAALARLTRRGEEEFARQAAAHEAWLDDLLSGLNAEQAHDIIHQLLRLSDKLEESSS